MNLIRIRPREYYAINSARFRCVTCTQQSFQLYLNRETSIPSSYSYHWKNLSWRIIQRVGIKMAEKFAGVISGFLSTIKIKLPTPCMLNRPKRRINGLELSAKPC